MERRLLLATLLLIFGIGIHQVWFMSLSDEYIISHGWKGGGCGLPDVLDFRGGVLRLHDNILYIKNDPLGRIVERKYRAYADSYMDILSQTGETCRYWGKWTN